MGEWGCHLTRLILQEVHFNPQSHQCVCVCVVGGGGAIYLSGGVMGSLSRAHSEELRDMFAL